MGDDQKQSSKMPQDDHQAATGSESNQVDPRLLEILVCPLTKGPLDYNSETQELLSFRGDVAFPIRNGVPLMTPEAARPLTEAEHARAKAKKR